MYKIYIIEDDELVAEIYKSKIEAEGYSVEVAHDGAAGYEKLKTFKPDLLLLDMMLPGLSGADLLVLLRGKDALKGLPVVAFTGTDDEEVIEDAIRFGATKALSKSEYTPAQIVARITEILAALPKTSQSESVLWQCIAEWTPPSGRVLIVEDDPIIMALARDVIEEEGYIVVGADDGRDAYRLLEGDDIFAAAIFDVNMPHIQGPDLVRHMKTNRRLMNIPVMIMTAEQSLGTQSESFSAGASMFIPKPFTRATLRNMFRSLMPGKITQVNSQQFLN